MMVRREVLEQIGYFDEDFFVWYADWDLCKRATDVGWQVYYLREATAIHHERRSFDKDSIHSDEIRYKIDGWYSAASQIQDRYLFLKKHSGRASMYGTKLINTAENALRILLILAGAASRGITRKEVSFRIRTCFQTIQAILKA